MPADNEDSHDVLTREANIHIENTASSSSDPPRKKLKHAAASLKWQRKPKLIKRKNCELEVKILLDLPVNASPLRVFESTTRLNDLVSLICDQTNLYAEQNGRTFRTTPEEVCAFLGVHFMMAICKSSRKNVFFCVEIIVFRFTSPSPTLITIKLISQLTYI